MAQQRHLNEDALKLLREFEIHLAAGHDVPEACRQAGISDVKRVLASIDADGGN